MLLKRYPDAQVVDEVSDVQVRNDPDGLKVFVNRRKTLQDNAGKLIAVLDGKRQTLTVDAGGALSAALNVIVQASDATAQREEDEQAAKAAEAKAKLDALRP